MKISDIVDTIETSSIGNLPEEIEEINNLIANSSKITTNNIKYLNYFVTTKFAIDEYKQKLVAEVAECIEDLKKATNLLENVKANIAAEKCTDNLHIQEEDM